MVDAIKSLRRVVSASVLRLSATVIALVALTLAAQAASLSDTFSSHSTASKSVVDHSALDRLLKTYVKSSADGLNRVDYLGFQRDGHSALKAYIGKLAAVDVAALDRSEQFAFWVNLYNAKTIDIVLDAYPIRSIKDVKLGGGLIAAFTGGPWTAKVVSLSGVDLSLNDIEHEILRPVFQDPRVHYAVNCASIGCPNLSIDAYTGATLDAQLNAAARSYINHPRGFSASGGGLVASSIYDWYKQDFGGSPQGVLAHAGAYADVKLKSAMQRAGTIDSYAYDWSLNDVRR